MTRRLLVAGTLVLSLIAIGCAKKAQTPPPAPPPPPPVQQPTTPAPPETTATTPAPTPTQILGTGDFSPAFFDLDSYSLRADAREALDKDAGVLRAHADAKITVEGHCDERGTEEYNQALGERRANAAKDYLVNAGIDAGRITTISYGKDHPFDPGHDEAAWAKNRRAQIVPQ